MDDLTFYIFLAIGLIFAAILASLYIFLVYSGLFTGVEVGAGPPPVKGAVVAYHYGRGAYRNCGYYFTELSSLAPNRRAIGFYYDDPEQVAQERLRWAVGCIVAEEGEKPDDNLVEILQDNGYKMFTLPHVTSVVRTKFPNTTFLSLFIGIYKVYPALAEYVRDHKLCAHPWIEIYEDSLIYYMAPLARQDEFYVPESLADDEEEDEDAEVETEPVLQQPYKFDDYREPSVDTGEVKAVQEATPVQGKAENTDATPTTESSTQEEEGTPACTFSATTAAVIAPERPTCKPASPVPSKTGSEVSGDSSSEVDTEGYEVIKPEDITNPI